MPMCTNPAPRHNDVPLRPPQRSGRVMPESADEATMASDDIRDDTKALLAKAAALWAEGGVEGGSTAPPGAPGSPVAPGQEVGDRIAFVTAYYRRVAPEDLIAAGPDRLAETVAKHAALGASRPQGRPAVGVRPAPSEGGVVGALTSAGTVVDIVTDDMPYLVDSVTMELNRHAADIRLIVHPVLTVGRDVAGTAHGMALAGDGAGPAATCGWQWRTGGGCAAPPGRWSRC